MPHITYVCYFKCKIVDFTDATNDTSQYLQTTAVTSKMAVMQGCRISLLPNTWVRFSGISRHVVQNPILIIGVHFPGGLID